MEIVKKSRMGIVDNEVVCVYVQTAYQFDSWAFEKGAQKFGGNKKKNRGKNQVHATGDTWQTVWLD